MKILLIILLGASFLAFQQKKEYVCTPCGSSCDMEIHSAPGICSQCQMKLVDKSTIHFTNLSADLFCQRITANPKAILLDVRTPEEFNGTVKDKPSFGKFKSAININVEELEKRLSELTKYKDREILVYCSHSHRSPRASYILDTHGFKNVKNMNGGVSTILTQLNDPCIKTHFEFHIGE